MIVSTKARKRRKLTPSQRQRVYANNGGYCVRCALPIDGAYDIDHIIPVSRGGTDDWYNLGPSHPECNRRHGQSLRNNALPRANVFTPRSAFFGRLPATPHPSRKNSAQ